MKYKGFIYTPAPKTAWDNLSMQEKSEMMKVAVKNGITDLKTIREKYNEFAEGGNLYAGTSTDNDLVDWIIKEEGFTAKPTDIGDGKITLGSGLTSQKWHDLYKKRGNKWSETDNRSAVAQEVASRRRWAEKNIPNWDTLPESSQKALLAYKYNYDFNAANSPKLFKALRNSNLHEAARQMNATSKDPRFQKGLVNRRKREQAWFLSDVGMPDIVPSSAPIIAQPVSTSVYNPYPVKIQNTTVAPRMVPDKDSYVKAHQLTEREIRQQKLQERWDAINRFNALMDMLNIQNNPLKQFTSNNPIFSGIEGLIHKDGGKIYIKPENKGKFTALKERTGHSATWFKEHGTPAQKKMATFALNSRHWKHGLGGNLFGGNENHSQQMITTGGAGYIPPTVVLTDDDKLKLSADMMENIRQFRNLNRRNEKIYSNDGGTPQNTYLLDRDTQKRIFLKNGYTERPGDYGLVRKAVGNRNIPVYQQNPDAISRAELTPIGNINDEWFGDSDKQLEHPGSFPTTIYRGIDGKFYQKAWDLNDYGGKGGSTANIFGQLLDIIGSPTVVTTGFQPVKSFLRRNIDYNGKIYTGDTYKKLVDEMMAKKGLYPIKDTDLYGLPEITITGNKHGLGGNLFQNGGDENSMNYEHRGTIFDDDLKNQGITHVAELPEVVVAGKKPERRHLPAALKKQIEADMKEAYVESNDNAWVDSPLTYNKKNLHLSRKAEEGAKQHAAWEKEHPNLTAWGNMAGAVPFAIASVPLGAGIVAGGDALAATTAGQAVTAGLAPLYQAATSATIADAPALAWADAGLTSAFGAHGISQAIEDGGISPMTSLEITPLWRLAKPMAKSIKFRPFTNNTPVAQWTKIGQEQPEFLNFGNIEDETFKFTGFAEDPIQIHLKRAEAKGYNTLGINIYDLSKDTPENTVFIEGIAKQYGLTPEQTRSFLMSHLNSHGHAAQFAGTRNIIHDNAGDNMSARISHEIDHLLHYPDEPIPDGAYYPRLRNVHGDYFTQHNNTELSARGSQLHDYFGHTGNEPITEDMLEYARQHYIQDIGLNNDMHDFLWTIKDNKKVADWLTKYATGIAPFGSFGPTMYNQKEK